MDINEATVNTWITHEDNKCIYRIDFIDQIGEYYATGLNYEGKFLERELFGNLDDLAGREVRKATVSEIEYVSINFNN